MNNTTLVREQSVASKKSRKAFRGSRAMRMEPLEIRALLAANTLDFVDNLSIETTGETRDLQLIVGDSSSKSLVGVRISGTSGNLDPGVPLVFVRDTDPTNPANHVPLMQALANANGTKDSLIIFEVEGGEEFTIQVGGSSGTGDFKAEVFLFGSTNADGSVSETEYMRAVAAELQARGAGNHNTAAYFQQIYGINFNQSQYNIAFDANANGKIDGFEVNMVAANKGNGPIDVDLIGDNEGPAINVSVAVDTGASNSDNITNDVSDTNGNAVVGQLVDQYSNIVSASISLEGGAAVSFDLADGSNPDGVNFLDVDGKTILFGLSASDLEELLGGSLADGTYTLNITATDDIGNVSEHEFTFTLDTTDPAQPTALDLVVASDTGSSDSDNITSETNPTFTVTAEPGARVEIFADGVSLGLATESKTTPGEYSFTVDEEEGLAEGSFDFTVVATDVAGNMSVESATLTVVIDTIAPADPSGLLLDNKTNPDFPLVTAATEATISGTTEAGAFVRVLDSNGAELATTTADGSGNFTLTGADLVLGENDLTIIATDAAGNPADVTYTVWRNTAPTIEGGQIFSIDENSPNATSVGPVVASGNDAGDTLTYAITGVEAGYEGAFAIDATTGNITVANSSLLDYEAGTSITLTIQVTDSYGNGLGGAGLTTTQQVTINLNDVNEAPSIVDAAVENVLENTTDPLNVNNPNGTLIYTVPVTDEDAGDTTAFEILAGNDNGAFAIDDDGNITVADASKLDFETNPTYELTVEVTDIGGLTSQAVITISLANVNESPVLEDDTLPSIDENQDGQSLNWEVGDLVATINSGDPDAGDTFTYTITGGNTDGAFAIDNQGNITIANPAAIDFETTEEFNLQIKVTDAGGLFSQATYTLGINNLNDGPAVDQDALSGITLEVDENAAGGTELTLDGTIVADLDDYFSDTDNDGLTYEIVGGDADGAFTIVGNEIVVADGSKLDFENLSSYTLTIRATDGEFTVDGTVAVELNNLNELPVDDGETVDLGTVSLLDVDADNEGSEILSVGLVDPEGDDLTYSIDSNSNFSIDANGKITVDTAVEQGDLDPVTGARTYTFTVTIADNNSLSLPNGTQSASNVTITFTVTDNDPPVIDAPTTTEFTIEENIDGSIQLGDNLMPELIVQATDPEGDEILLPTIEPSTANPNPALASLFEVIEDNGGWRVVVANADGLTYNNVNSLGAVDGEFTVDLVVTDVNNRSSRLTLTITVTDENNTPTFEAPTTIQIEEFVETTTGSLGAVDGQVVLNLDTAFADEDNGTVLTYTLDSATVDGVDISAAFVIVDNEVRIANASLLNYEALTGDIILTITANDGSGEDNNTVTGNITVEVTDENELPILDSPTEAFETRYKYVDGDGEDDKSDLGNIFEDGPLTWADPEGDDIVITQRAGEGTGAEYFSIDAAGNITVIKDVEFAEDSKEFTLVFDYADNNVPPLTSGAVGLDGIELVIRVTKNAPPVITSAGNFAVDENTVDGTVVHTVTATDQEGEDIAYAIIDPTGAFTINAETGVITVADSSYLDAEQRTSFDITVSAEDTAGNVTEQTITVTINNINDVNPVGDDVTINGVTENTAGATPNENGDILGQVVVTDDDVVQTPITYEIISGNESGAFGIDANGNIFVADETALDYDTNPTFVLQVVATDENGSGLVSQPITVTINLVNVNEAPELTGDAITLDPVDESGITATGNTFEVRYSNDDFGFLAQFSDPENDDLDLQIANLDDYFVTKDSVKQPLSFFADAYYDNTSDELVVIYYHYAAGQDRSPITFELQATESSTGDQFAAAQTLDVHVSAEVEDAVDFRFIAVSSPTDAAGGLQGAYEAELPEGLTRVADEQTFFVEMWVASNIGRDQVALNRAWANGFRTINLAIDYDESLVTVNNVYRPEQLQKVGGNPEWGNGEIREFNATFTLGDTPYTGGADGYDDAAQVPHFVRIGFIEVTVAEGVSLDDVSNLMTLNYDPALDTETSFVLNPETEGTRTGSSAILESVHQTQVTVQQSELDIVDAVRFEISQGHSLASILVGPTGSKINGAEVAGQGGNGIGNVTNVTGNIFVVFNGPANNPTSFEIIGSELILGSSGNYVPDNASGNFGLISTNDQGGGFVTTTNVAVRETVIRIAGSSTVELSGNPYNSEVGFSSAGLQYHISEGNADIQAANTFNGKAAGTVNAEESLAGYILGSNGAENSTLQGNGTGAYSLTLDLSRVFANTVYDVGGVDVPVNLLIDGTIVANVNGGVPLHGTVFAKDGQPLEDGSGVFVTVVKDRTQLGVGGQVAELPRSTQWASEWDSLWVEVWGNTADFDGVYGGTIDLGYDTSLYTATQIEYADSMSLNRTGTIDDVTGTITGLGSESSQTNLGNGQFVLLGRVKLESLDGDGIDVSLQEDFKPESLGLTTANASLNLTGFGSRDADVAEVPQVDIWAVAYDADDNGKIGLSDFTKFVQAFGQSSLTTNQAMIDALDFDNNGQVGLSDFTEFVKNFGKGKEDARDILYPETFTQTWVGRKVELEGPDSLSDVFDRAVADWQDALGWDQPLDVKLVVKDYGNAQLGEAQLLALDENGLPQFGILTLDDDGAGLGWSSDLAGGPAEGQYDLYTVILHELGHLYGFMSHYSGFAANVVTDHEGNQTYIGADFAALLDDYAHHLDDTAHAGDVMNGLLDPGMRKTISALDVQILQAAYASAQSGASVYGGSAALHANVQDELLASETSVTFEAQPLKFAFDKVVDVETVSGQTGFAAAIAPRVQDELNRNGIRVTTSTLPEFQQRMDEIDSAVATFLVDDQTLVAVSTLEENEELTFEEESTDVDSLFAAWDLDGDLDA